MDTDPKFDQNQSSTNVLDRPSTQKKEKHLESFPMWWLSFITLVYSVVGMTSKEVKACKK